MCPCEAGGLAGDGAAEAEADVCAGPPAGPEPGLGLPWGWWGA